MNNLLEPWERARRGLHTVVLGFALAEPPQDLRVVRVSCDVPSTTLGSLVEARARIERILGTSAPLVEMARTRVMSGLRRHLLGDVLSATSEGSLVDVCNRFAALGPSALVLDAADFADPASLDMLRHILARPGWLRLPVILVLRSEPVAGAAAALIDAVRAAFGDEAILGARGLSDDGARTPSAPHEAAGATGPKTVLLPALPELGSQALPADVLRVLRALALVGSGCEATLLAAVLDVSELHVLEALQRAADAGVPVEDRGEGRVHLPPAVIAVLRQSLLPSLAAALHRRIASTLGQERAPTPAVPELLSAAEPNGGEEVPRPGNAWDVMQASPPPTMRLSGAQEAPAPATQAASAPAPAARSTELAPETTESPIRSTDQAAARAADEVLGAGAFERAAARLEEKAAAAKLAREEAAERVEDAGEAQRTSFESATSEPVEAVERSAEDAADDAAERAAELAAAQALREAALAAQAEAVRKSEVRAVEEAAQRAAEEAAAHAVSEVRRANETAVEKDARERHDAEHAAVQAVERAKRELAEERGAPAYYKPFSGEVAPPIAARPPGKWLSPLASEAAPTTAREGAAGARGQARSPAPRGSEPSAHGRERHEARPGDEARAARHLAAAGDPEGAIERYFQAVQKAAAAAAYPQAVAHANAALALLDRLPPTEMHRVQRVQLLLEAGRVLWHGAGPDESFTLQGALRVLESARASLHADDPADIVADVAVTIAGILYEIGDLASLERALAELSNASRALSEAGEPRAAARLFNDQASVYIRLGDPVRAAHLLTESRKIFEEAAKTDPIAMVEMAETDHSFARILLSVPARPGREDDALSLGLDHALAAERAFRRLGAPREAGRVLETMGRIELRKGRVQRAAERLTTAVKIQESIGDVVGLARSTAALSDTMARAGQMQEALNLLADSIVLNFEKGSKLGLAFNRRALEALGRDETTRRTSAGLLAELTARLSSLENKLGRVEIPGSANPQ